MNKLLISLALALTVSNVANGTTIVAFRNSQQAVLAADSRYSTLTTHKELFSGNKIKRCGDYYMAMAGLYTITVSNSVEDLSRIPLACKAGQSPLEAIDAVMRELEMTYSRMLLSVKQAKLVSRLSKSSFKPGEFGLNLVLIGSYQGVPFILTRNIEPSFEEDNLVVRWERPWTFLTKLSEGETQYAFGGVYSDLNSYAREKNLDQPSSGLEEAARELVSYQIGRTPEVSGYPIHIVSVNAKGEVSWLSCNKSCQAPAPDTSPGLKGKKLIEPSMSGKSAS